MFYVENKVLEQTVRESFARLEKEMKAVRKTHAELLAAKNEMMAGGGAGSSSGGGGGGGGEEVAELQARVAKYEKREAKLKAKLAKALGGSGGGGGEEENAGGESGEGGEGGEGASAAALQAEFEAKEAKLNEWMQKQLQAEQAKREREKAALQQRIDELEAMSATDAEQKEAMLKKLKRSLAASGTADFAAGLRALHKKFVALKSDFASLKDEAYKQRKTIAPDIQQFADMVRDKVEEESERTEAAVAKYRVAMQKNKKLYNKLQEMRGNIRVYCRTRPLSEAELGDGQIMAATVTGEDEVTVVDAARDNARKVFKFDRVYGPGTRQEEVFQDTKPLVTSVLDGYNVCIFAYGQTGSGKTYTMEGPDDNPGINKRTLQELFRIAEERAEDFDISITVSNMEIYNENIYDLLAEPAPEGIHSISSRLDIRMGTQGIDVPGLTEETCSSIEDVLDVIARGASNRSTFATDMNEHSSRSHAILRIVARCQNKISRVATIGKLSLVDLAGSERVAKSGVTKERLLEAQNINRSLSALGDVIQSLTAKNQSHIPYRNSKLTFLLADSLGGDSKTLMFVQVAPGSYNAPETICSLNFAIRVRSVKLQLASVHTESPELSEYKDMVAKLQAKLAAAGS